MYLIEENDQWRFFAFLCWVFRQAKDFIWNLHLCCHHTGFKSLFWPKKRSLLNQVVIFTVLTYYWMWLSELKQCGVFCRFLGGKLVFWRNGLVDFGENLKLWIWLKKSSLMLRIDQWRFFVILRWVFRQAKYLFGIFIFVAFALVLKTHCGQSTEVYWIR